MPDTHLKRTGSRLFVDVTPETRLKLDLLDKPAGLLVVCGWKLVAHLKTRWIKIKRVCP